MKKLTPALRRSITRDWEGCFPELGVYKPMHLLRRCGPLLIGIVLERDSSNETYLPTFHVHNLTRYFEVITLTLAQPLHTERNLAPKSIYVQWHDTSFTEAANLLTRQAPLPFEGNLKLEEVMSAYRAYLETPLGRYQEYLFEDMALINAWASQTEKALRILNEGKRKIAEWPDYVQKGIDVDQWHEKKLHAVNAKSISETVAQEIERLNLNSIPVSDLLV